MLFRKLGLFLSSGEGRKILTLLGPLERMETDPVSETSCFRGFFCFVFVLVIPDNGQSPERQ
jgi:hypothetical protein